ncbi:MAG: hypothetical protein U5J63_06820 [Fodinibius sp.]|nr:hypothetical protein [Fodinibius sp.]
MPTYHPGKISTATSVFGKGRKGFGTYKLQWRLGVIVTRTSRTGFL